MYFVLKVIRVLFFFVCLFVFRLNRPPQTLAELRESLKLLETLQGTLTQTEAQISLLHEQFALLHKYKVHVEKSVSTVFFIKS